MSRLNSLLPPPASETCEHQPISGFLVCLVSLSVYSWARTTLFSFLRPYGRTCFLGYLILPSQYETSACLQILESSQTKAQLPVPPSLSEGLQAGDVFNLCGSQLPVCLPENHVFLWGFLRITVLRIKSLAWCTTHGRLSTNWGNQSFCQISAC